VLDQQGNVTASYDYDPYGKLTNSPATTPEFGYAGMQYHAPSGLYLTKYRAYEPQSGRWLSRDPIEEVGGINLYAYVEESPISRIDPDGLWWQVIIPGLIVGGGLYLYDQCLDKCNQGRFCPDDSDSRKRFGDCANYCTNLTALWMTLLDGGFHNTKPPMSSPTSTAGTLGGASGQ
jgi:RHS repeat-associated protein